MYNIKTQLWLHYFEVYTEKFVHGPKNDGPTTRKKGFAIDYGERGWRVRKRLSRVNLAAPMVSFFPTPISSPCARSFIWKTIINCHPPVLHFLLSFWRGNYPVSYPFDPAKLFVSICTWWRKTRIHKKKLRLGLFIWYIYTAGDFLWVLICFELLEQVIELGTASINGCEAEYKFTMIN